MPEAQRNKNSHEMYLKYHGPRKPPDDAIYLNAREAAYVLRVSYKTILEYVGRRRNKPPVTYLSPNVLRFPRAALLEWAAKQGN